MKVSMGLETRTVCAVESLTPLLNLDDLFKGALLHVWDTSGGNPDPLDGSHTAITLDGGNDSNNFYTTGANFPTITNDHSYRITYVLDQISVDGNAQLDLAEGDLILGDCDVESDDATTIAVAAGSSLTVNSLSSSNCTSAAVSGSVTITNDYLQ